MADSQYSTVEKLPDFSGWDRIAGRRVPLSMDLEVTARCNNDCRHCYINLPAGDADAKAAELSVAEIDDLALQASELGTLWCLLSGGEPLLREDFEDVYLALRRRGLLVSLFTNACLVKPEHVELLLRHPPRELEVTVYGVTAETYEAVTRRPGSFAAFMRGLTLLEDAGLRPRLKAMALRSNLHEFADIAEFCRAHTRDYFRFDPQLTLRYDRDAKRNEEICSERLTNDEITELERRDPKRFEQLQNTCKNGLAVGGPPPVTTLVRCGAGIQSFSVGYNGTVRVCSSLWHPDWIYELRSGNLRDAWQRFIPGVLARAAPGSPIIEHCSGCALINVCLSCPAHAYLETGEVDAWVEGFCVTAHARADNVLDTQSTERGQEETLS